METFLLVLSFAIQGQPTESTAVGIMANEQICNVAGLGMKIVLEQTNPGIIVNWVCMKQEAA